MPGDLRLVYRAHVRPEFQDLRVGVGDVHESQIRQLDRAIGLGRSGGVCGHPRDRKSTRLNSSHLVISYAVFCLKKKKTAHSRTLNLPCPLPAPAIQTPSTGSRMRTKTINSSIRSTTAATTKPAAAI